MSKGVRVIAVINRKGGCGKSTLVRGLASAAVARGERVTVFDTDSSQSIYGWMKVAKQLGNWNDHAEVLHTYDPEEITARLDAIYAEPAHDHLVLIDTFGGSSEALDDVVLQAHLIVAPVRPGRGDYLETMQTLMWRERLKGRVDDPASVPEYRVVINAVSAEPSATDTTSSVPISVLGFQPSELAATVAPTALTACEAAMYWSRVASALAATVGYIRFGRRATIGAIRSLLATMAFATANGSWNDEA